MYGLRMVCKKQVAIRYPAKDIRNMEELVSLGYANNISDYVRTATREKIVRDRAKLNEVV